MLVHMTTKLFRTPLVLFRKKEGRSSKHQITQPQDICPGTIILIARTSANYGGYRLTNKDRTSCASYLAFPVLTPALS